MNLIESTKVGKNLPRVPAGFPFKAVESRKREITEILSRWGSEHLRSFPWRLPSRPPYEILLAELLLKRTTATAAAKVYPHILSRFPTLASLSSSTTRELEDILAPIGLQVQRARAIKALTDHLNIEHKGIIPSTFQELSESPGLGPYSARAVLSFGFGVPSAVCDSNVKRVLQRIFAKSLRYKEQDSHFQRIADALLPAQGHSLHNYALLDLGSLVCRYDRPRCLHCPLSGLCDSAATFGELNDRTSTEAQILRSARRNAGLTLLELARRAGVSKGTIINTEAGRTRPNHKTMEKLTSVLGVSFSEEPDVL